MMKRLKGNSIFQILLICGCRMMLVHRKQAQPEQTPKTMVMKGTPTSWESFIYFLHFLVNPNLVIHADKVSAMLAYRVRRFKQLTLSCRHYFFLAQFHFSSRAELRGEEKTIIWGSSTDLYYMSAKQQQHHQQRCRQRSCRRHTCVTLRGNKDIILIWGRVWPCS